MKIWKQIFSLLLLGLISWSTVSAQTVSPNLKDSFQTRDGAICSGNDTLDCVSNTAGFDVNKVTAGGQNDTIEPLIANIIDIVLSLLGVIFIAFIVYAGWLWLSARGVEAKVDRAKNIITESVIGLLIVIGAYAISYFVLNAFSQYTK